AQAWIPGRPIPAPLRLHDTRVAPEWADYNGHMSESCYLLVFGDGADSFFRFFGVDEDYRAGGRSLFTAETHLRHLREARVGYRLRLTLQVLGWTPSGCTSRLRCWTTPARWCPPPSSCCCTSTPQPAASRPFRARFSNGSWRSGPRTPR